MSPEAFEKLYSIFIGAILLFFAYAGIRILMMQSRWKHRQAPPRRSPVPAGGGTGRDSEGTFGTSGIGASDMAPAGFAVASAGDTGSTPVETSSEGGGDSGGGSDFSGGGGESGGGGASGGWND